MKSDILKISNKTFKSRLIVGTGKYKIFFKKSYRKVKNTN